LLRYHTSSIHTSLGLSIATMQHRQPLAFLTALVLVAMAATLVSSGDVAIVPLDISFMCVSVLVPQRSAGI